MDDSELDDGWEFVEIMDELILARDDAEADLALDLELDLSVDLAFEDEVEPDEYPESMRSEECVLVLGGREGRAATA